MLALRLAGHQLVTEEIGSSPILLLDDVFSELDPARSEALLACVPGGQAVVTSADVGELPTGGERSDPHPYRGREAAVVTTWRSAEPGPVECEPRPVADSLDRVTRAFGAPRARLLAAVFSRWEELVGPEIARHAQPRSLRGGVLVLTADQPAWATQLRYMAAGAAGARPSRCGRPGDH